MRVLALVCLSMVAMVVAAPDGKYTDKYDNIDLDESLSNKRILESYFKCLMDEGPCSPEGRELKGNMNEALEQDCAKCTEKQKAGADKVIAHLMKYEKEWWQKISDKYDPEHKYVVKYEAKLKSLA